jgi:hypothetical protein
MVNDCHLKLRCQKDLMPNNLESKEVILLNASMENVFLQQLRLV